MLIQIILLHCHSRSCFLLFEKKGMISETNTFPRIPVTFKFSKTFSRKLNQCIVYGVEPNSSLKNRHGCTSGIPHRSKIRPAGQKEIVFDLFTLCYLRSVAASPKLFWGTKNVDFRRATAFCLHRLSKHKITRYAENFRGKHGPQVHPWLHVCTRMHYIQSP